MPAVHSPVCLPRRAWPLHALSVALILGLSGCAAVGPNFSAPAAPKAEHYTPQALPAQTQATAGTAQGQSQTFSPNPVSGFWWQSFNNPALDALITQALQNSPSLTAAQARLEQARKAYQAQAGATQLPQVNGSFTGQEQGSNNSQMGQEGGKRQFALYHAGLSVSYNLDLFGGNRRTLEALAAQADYQHYELAAARLSLAGNIAVQAMTQAMLNDQIHTTQAILADQDRQIELMSAKLALGAATRADVLSLKTQRAQTAATLPPLQFKRAQTDHLLASLTGQLPANAAIPQFSLDQFTLPATLPVVVPSAWVAARPDIAAANSLLHVASAQYGVALSNLYPQINLSATLGSQALTPAALFNADSIIWSLISGITQPLFNVGLKAGAEGAKAALSEAAANYQQAVLDGLRNTADALRAVEIDAHTLNAQVAAQSAAQDSLALTEQQLKLGSATALQLLTAQQQVQQTRLLTLAARMQRLTDSVALYQAMGSTTLPHKDQSSDTLPKKDQGSDTLPSKDQHSATAPAPLTPSHPHDLPETVTP